MSIYATYIHNVTMCIWVQSQFAFNAEILETIYPKSGTYIVRTRKYCIRAYLDACLMGHGAWAITHKPPITILWYIEDFIYYKNANVAYLIPYVIVTVWIRLMCRANQRNLHDLSCSNNWPKNLYNCIQMHLSNIQQKCLAIDCNPESGFYHLIWHLDELQRSLINLVGYN